MSSENSAVTPMEDRTIVHIRTLKNRSLDAIAGVISITVNTKLQFLGKSEARYEAAEERRTERNDTYILHVLLGALFAPEVRTKAVTIGTTTLRVEYDANAHTPDEFEDIVEVALRNAGFEYSIVVP